MFRNSELRLTHDFHKQSSTCFPTFSARPNISYPSFTQAKPCPSFTTVLFFTSYILCNHTMDDYRKYRNTDNRPSPASSRGPSSYRSDDSYSDAPPPRGSSRGGRSNASRYYEEDEDGEPYASSRFAQQQEEEEVQGIKQQIGFVKQESLQSTRNAVDKIRQAEDAAGNTLNMLGTQSQQLANIDRNLDTAKEYSDRAADKTNELKQLNRSIFLPVIKNPFTRKSREQAELNAVARDTAEHSKERQNIRKAEYESQQRIEQAQKKNERMGSNGSRAPRSQSDRDRYQFEANAEDDAVEDEIDQNLDYLGDATARLKNMALTMNQELDSQNRTLDKVSKKVDPLNERVRLTGHRLNGIN
ncbi:hypothetical protein BC937DRAFT_90843 [Endogone sp. FLAS-F59071]|nr:hypothetical protein BC937DRAFT_90843 [Endogone sp. FLAS-F59071]|eukprot:RUS21970.1 hypothetical protein BC937DRAFT_90843 [Endogone sp. FLAS-F59071]